MQLQDFIEKTISDLVKAGARGNVSFDLWVMPCTYRVDGKWVNYIEIVDNSSNATNMKFTLNLDLIKKD